MFDRADLERAIAVHGAVGRIVLLDVRGSVPRPAGTAMLIWEGGQSGTIGGGA
ncbi:MAG: XdhC family protein, partial [Pseudomonadota bacterium]|nr:XdhC family protein [Pseudomonadota bacterium]